MGQGDNHTHRVEVRVEVRVGVRVGVRVEARGLWGKGTITHTELRSGLGSGLGSELASGQFTPLLQGGTCIAQEAHRQGTASSLSSLSSLSTMPSSCLARLGVGSPPCWQGLSPGPFCAVSAFSAMPGGLVSIGPLCGCAYGWDYGYI